MGRHAQEREVDLAGIGRLMVGWTRALEQQGQSALAQPIAVETPHLGGDLDYVASPSAIHSRANLAAEYVAAFLIQSTNGTALGLVGVGDLVLPQIPGDRLRHVRWRSRNFGLTSRHQPGSDSRRECPEWRESSCLPHAQQHARSRRHEAGKVSQGFGNV